MSAQDEWGPWIEHDGTGCPCVGHAVHVKYRWSGENPDGSISDERVYVASSESWSWVWGQDGINEVIRYRIRKPRGMAVLESILTDLPAPAEQVDA